MPELGQSVKRFLSEPGLSEEEKARRTVECLKYLRAYFEGLVSGLIGSGLETFLADEAHNAPVHRDIRSVFLDLGGAPRFVTRWLGLAGQRPPTPPPVTALWALGDETLLEEVVSYNALLQEWLRSARAFEENWAVEPDRVRHRDSSTVYPLDPPLDPEQLGPLHPAAPGPPADLTQAINQVKTLFEPLSEPYFDLLGIPGLTGPTGEFEAKVSRPVAPTELLERPPARASGRRVPLEPAFPPHLKILACRLSDALERQDPVASANATVEAIDYMVRFFAGVAGGGLAELEASQEKAPVDLEFDECLELLRNSVQALRVYRGDVIADSILAVFEPGGSRPDHHSWLGLGERTAEEDPAVWRVRADSRIQDEDPGPCAQLLKGILPILSDWLEASKYFFNCWDLYHVIRRDFNLDVRLARGDRAFNAFPLVYPERYGIVLAQPDLNKAREHPNWEPRGFGQGPSVANLSVPEPADEDPPHLARLLEEFGKAVRDEEPLPAGNALLGCFDFLLRYYASLSTGALRSIAPFPLESVLAESASLLHCSKLLHYSLFALDRFPEHPVSSLVGGVFFEGERPRAFTRWLGFAGSPLSGLENLSGWTHMLRRPDAALRIDEILGQIRVYAQFLSEWVAQSRHVFKTLGHHYDVGEGSNSVGVVFELEGTRFRGVPDIYVGDYEFHLSREEVLASAETLPSPMSEQSFEAWEAALQEELPTSVFDDDPELTELVPELADFESGPIVMPSLFPDEPAPPTWGQAEADGFSRYCQALNYSGPESRPKIFSERVAAFVAKRESGLILVEGGPGFGKTFLSRTLTNPRSSPFDTNFPVIHYSVGRRLEGDYGILIEVLNEHLGQQTELAEAGFSKLDPRVIRDLNVRYPEGQASSRFLAYLSALSIANSNRRFLLVLDGLDESQAAAEAGLTVLDFLPSRLPEGVFLMLTYRPDFRAQLDARLDLGHDHCLELKLDSEDPTYQGLLYQHLEKIEWKVADLNALIKKAGGGLALSKLLRDGVACEYYGAPAELPARDRIFESFLEALHSRFPQDERFEAGVRFLMLLAAAQRPLSVPMLIELACDPVAVRKITELFPSAFAFWGEDEPVVGLAHDWLATCLREGRPEQFREACLELLALFESEPDSGWLSLAFWWAIEGADARRLEAFAESEKLREFRQARLAELDSSRRYHEKVVLLDG
ncbi:MAG: ATP-binding protein, partial [Candidatus Eremiobacteraeota bacterium]|nr:ATP-binding protein [Candidatus Eremiobacteraeota bacterium]